MIAKQFLSKLKVAILTKLGVDRVHSVILFGSAARGNAADDSDIDLLVVVNDREIVSTDLQNIIAVTYPFQMECDLPFHFSLARSCDFNAGTFGLYRTIKSEGTVL